MEEANEAALSRYYIALVNYGDEQTQRKRKTSVYYNLNCKLSCQCRDMQALSLEYVHSVEVEETSGG